MDFRDRLVGARTVERYGIDLTGKRFTEACFIGTPAEAQAAMTEFGRIYLQLAEDGGATDMILGYQQSRILVHPEGRVR
jgi:hypothetical protein